MLLKLVLKNSLLVEVEEAVFILIQFSSKKIELTTLHV